MEEQQEEGLPSPRSDLVSGGVWAVIGIAIGIGSWRMDRLESQGVPGYAAPGLVPGILGVLITLTGLWIVLRSVHRGALRPGGAAAAAGVEWGRSGLALGLCVGFAAVLVGHGLPFWLASSIYLFLHIFLLELPDRRATGRLGRGLLSAAAIALVAGVAIAAIFQYAFLVRLP